MPYKTALRILQLIKFTVKVEGKAPEMKMTDEEVIKFNRYKFNEQEKTRHPDQPQKIKENDLYLEFYPDGNDERLEYESIPVLK